MSEHPTRAAEPRQRWRMVVARAADAPPQPQRDLADAWMAAIEAAGLPVAWTEGARPRPRIAFGAPLPVGMAAEAELIDVVTTERWPAWQVRAALAGHVPPGWHLVEVEDVWLAGPPLAGRVAAADHRIMLAGEPPIEDLRAAAAGLLSAPTLPRHRAKGEGTVEYDLRALLIDVAIDDGSPVVVRTRTRIHPELGSGRPEEVLAALAERLGEPLKAASIVRERLVLIDDLATTGRA